jgi:hypothetical protein
MTDISLHKDQRWFVQPASEAALLSILDRLFEKSAEARDFRAVLLAGAAVRLRDIVDHIQISDPAMLDLVERSGWGRGEDGVWRNPAGFFPPILEAASFRVWLRVESVDHFLATHGLASPVRGKPYSPIRFAEAWGDGSAGLGVIERNGHDGFDVADVSDQLIGTARRHFEAFRTRRRMFGTVEEGLAQTEALVDAAVAALGPHWSASLWLHAERDYWMQRCAAGALQKARQDAVGIGWGNIDHDTYDSSRQHFRHMIRILEKLGYQRREMLYAGELAGWGSQVLEQPVLGSTVFADVDLAPEELDVNFSDETLPALSRHRRAGLLSELLGESMLEAGLNHVAALFDQALLRAQLEAAGVRMMSPFSDFPHLYQELTAGDWGPVDPARVDALYERGHIDFREAEKLRFEGSIVTHFENIERNDGFKGFNREGIDSVLRKIDPRAYHGEGAAE